MATSEKFNYVVHVRTGDRKRAGTDANIRIIFHGTNGTRTDKIRLHNIFKNDFECGQLDKFNIHTHIDVGDIEKIELWRDNFGLGARWYCDYITIKKNGDETVFSFPIYRWIKAEVHHIFRLHDTMLPQHDPMTDQRSQELEGKRKQYQLTQKIPGGPAQDQTPLVVVYTR